MIAQTCLSLRYMHIICDEYHNSLNWLMATLIYNTFIFTHLIAAANNIGNNIRATHVAAVQQLGKYTMS